MEYDRIERAVSFFFGKTSDMKNDEADREYLFYMNREQVKPRMIEILLYAWDDDEYSWKELLLKHEVIEDEEPVSESESRKFAWELLIQPLLDIKRDQDVRGLEKPD